MTIYLNNRPYSGVKMSTTAFTKSNSDSGSIKFQVGRNMFQSTSFEGYVSAVSIEYKRIQGQEGKELHYKLDASGCPLPIIIVIKNESRPGVAFDWSKSSISMMSRPNGTDDLGEVITLGFKKGIEDSGSYYEHMLAKEEHPLTQLTKALNHVRTVFIDNMQNSNPEDLIFYIRGTKFLNDVMTLITIAKSVQTKENGNGIPLRA